MEHDFRLTRRGFATAVAAIGTLAILGCGEDAQSRTEPGAPQSQAPAGAEEMVVYRDPNCPCCEKWAAMAKEAGYQVRVIDHPDMTRIKAQYGVPEALRSCHTTIVGDYALEGHVPFEHVARLLRERPDAILGLAVAGMPAGSPGMEVPDGAKDDFAVMAFRKHGAPSPFAA